MPDISILEFNMYLVSSQTPKTCNWVTYTSIQVVIDLSKMDLIHSNEVQQF